ncbi:MAG: hypothetical protein J0M11_20625, partial [Anaerolineae bacterium]|nr:hypothetical protein [Anaerolineae bacterium]
VLHHMADAPKALAQIQATLQPGAVFILEFANKLNLKAILRYWLGKQEWNPFSLEPVEFVKLNFDFHPKAIRNWLGGLGFTLEKMLTVSHFRLGLLKRLIPANILAAVDGLFQPTGALFQFTPSVFVKAVLPGEPNVDIPLKVIELLKCPDCNHGNLKENADHLACPACGAKWSVRDGIYDFREKLN